MGLLMALIVFVGLELFWRSLGHRPSITPTAALWSYQRERVERGDRRTIALLGGSRMQMGFDAAAFEEEHPSSSVAQLAVAGSGPFAALRDLAESSRFAGLVICSISAQALHWSALERQGEFVDYFHSRWSPGKKLELFATAALQDRLVVLQRNLVGRPLLRSLAAGDLPLTNFVRTTFARRRIADYSAVDLNELIESRIRFNERVLGLHPPASEEQWRAIVAELAAHVRSIEARGGRVVFVRFPTRARYNRLLDGFFPRARYWDVLASSVGTLALHHEDMAGVAALDCPDESHLDPPGAIAFTRAIAREIASHGLL